MRKNTGNLKITTPSDREIALTRVMNAPRHLVFDAFTKPDLLKRWLGTHDGWTLAVCEIDLRLGGAIRYLWKGPKGQEMGLSGVYREIVIPERLVSTERFDESWYEGEGVGTVTFVEHEGKTTITQTLLYGTKAIRDAVLKSPMEHGIAAGYDTLEKLLESP